MKLSHQSLLALDFDSATGAHSIKIVPSLGQSFQSWSAHTRVSPVWLYSADEDDRAVALDDTHYGLAFFSSVNPAAFTSHFGVESGGSAFGDIWVSLGAYNLIVVLATEQSAVLAKEFASGVGAALELWELGSKQADESLLVKDIRYVLPDRSADLSKIEPIISEIDRTEPHFKSLLMELSALLAMGAKRSAIQLPTLSSDFDSIAETAFLAITTPPALRSDGDIDEIKRASVLSDLHNINAGLSRLTSQALSGASPIVKTECHFWPHSLLGIGTANRALRNIVAFIGDMLHEFNFEGRSEGLLKRPPPFNTPSRFVPFADLMEYSALDNEPDSVEAPVPVVPITYFSGRDGFKNSAFTTSAPLLSISAGNSYQFSLVTITHEISHRIVASQIAAMLEELDYEFPTFRELTSSTKPKPASYAQVFFEEMFTALNAMAHEHLKIDGSNYRDDTRHLDSIFRDYGEEFEEHLVHVFDFWYFFNRDPALYISTIWCSWAVLPGIAGRIEEYVVRTLVALAANRTSSPSWLEDSKAEMLRQFQNLPRLKGLHLAEDVIHLLTDPAKGEIITARVNARQNVIRVFHMIMKSEKLAAFFAKEELQADRRTRTKSRRSTTSESIYGFTEKEFSPSQFANPIRFLNRYAADDKADPVKSAWVLLMLAFNMHRKVGNG